MKPEETYTVVFDTKDGGITPAIPMKDESDNSFELAWLYAEQALGLELAIDTGTGFPLFVYYRGEEEVGGG